MEELGALRWMEKNTGGTEVLVQGDTGLMVTRPSLSEQPQEPVPGLKKLCFNLKQKHQKQN